MIRRIGIIAAFLAWAISQTLQAEEFDPTAAMVFKAFVGTREITISNKVSKWSPHATERKFVEVMTPILQGRFVLCREIKDNGWASCMVLGYDSKTKSFPMTFFASDLYGTHWNGTWDEATKTLNSIATDTPDGWTSGATNRIPNGDNVEAAAWMKDETGALLLNSTYLKKRLPDLVDPVLAKAPEKLAAALEKSTETKVLNRQIGAWDSELVYEPSEWNPAEKKATRTTQSRWVIEDKFVFSLATDSDGSETLFITCFDPHLKLFKQFRYTSKGETTEMTGEWDQLAESLTMKSKINNLDFRIVQRFWDDKSYDWRGAVTDAQGKVYFKMTGKATSKKE